MPALESRWDWYDATFDGFDEGQMPAALALALGAGVTRGKGRNGYAICAVIERDEDVLARVYERSARPGEVHVSVSSTACDEVVPLLRRLYPVHRVSRGDSAVDFVADFDTLDARVLAFADERSLTHSIVRGSDGGATRYVGSPRSEVRMRLYRKTEQMRAAHPERAHEVPEGLVRFELQVRPGKRDLKSVLAQVGPDDAWGFSQWSTDLAALVLDLDAERTATHFRRPSDFSRALHFLGQQYGPLIRARADLTTRAEVLALVADALGIGAE